MNHINKSEGEFNHLKLHGLMWEAIIQKGEKTLSMPSDYLLLYKILFLK